MKLNAIFPSLLVATVSLPPVEPPPKMLAGPVETVKQIRSTARIERIDRVQMRLTLRHGPIPELGWPAATTSLDVSPHLPLGTLWPGQQIVFTLDDHGRIIHIAPVLEADAIPPFPDP